MDSIEEFKNKYSNLEVDKLNLSDAFIDLINDFDALKEKIIKRRLKETHEYISELINANSEMAAEELKNKLKEFEAGKNYDSEIAKLYLIRREIELSWASADSISNGGITNGCK